MNILTNPIVVALLALLAIPGVTSGLTGILKKMQTATGIDSRVFVYVASLLVTGAVVVTGGLNFPEFGGDPAIVVGAWLGWMTANAELARRLHEFLVERVPTD
jgi:hypothetical protein